MIANILLSAALLLQTPGLITPPYLDPGADGAFGLCSSADQHPVPDFVCTTAPLECYVPCLAAAIEDYLFRVAELQDDYCNAGRAWADAYARRAFDLLRNAVEDANACQYVACVNRVWAKYANNLTELNQETQDAVDYLRQEAEREYRRAEADFLEAAEHCCQDCTQGGND